FAQAVARRLRCQVSPGDLGILPLIEGTQARLELGHLRIDTLDLSLLHRQEQQCADNRLDCRGDVTAFGWVAPRIDQVAVARDAAASADQVGKFLELVCREADALRIAALPIPCGVN